MTQKFPSTSMWAIQQVLWDVRCCLPLKGGDHCYAYVIGLLQGSTSRPTIPGGCKMHQAELTIIISHKGGIMLRDKIPWSGFLCYRKIPIIQQPLEMIFIVAVLVVFSPSEGPCCDPLTCSIRNTSSLCLNETSCANHTFCKYPLNKLVRLYSCTAVASDCLNTYSTV